MNKTELPLTEKELDTILSFLEKQDDFVFLDTNRIDSTNSCSYIFAGMQTRLSLKKGEDIEGFFHQAEKYLKQGFFLAGWMAYEIGYLLEPSLNYLRENDDNEIMADFGVYLRPITFDHKTRQFSSHFPSGDNFPANKRNKEKSTPAFTIQNLRPNQKHKDYLANIGRIKSYIEQGDTYQVNYTLKLLFDFKGDPAALFKTLRNSQSVSYGAYLKLGGRTIQSFSPELFFRKSDTTCTVRPMKGTTARGKTLSDDTLQASKLQKDIKNRSENVMIVDLLRNDLGRICKMGQVETTSLFDIETFRTLHQMTSTIKGNLLPNISLLDQFKALFPCGSVTGAPKIRTMEIIKELENETRGVYTGAIGFISPQKDMVFNVPIRTVVLNGNKGEMGIGSGIVHDSSPEDEWQESLLKGHFLTDPAPEFQIIETILWEPKNDFFLLNEHMHRLTQTAAYYDFVVENQNILDELNKQATNWSAQKDHRGTNRPTAQMVRVLLYRDGKFSITAKPCESPKETSLPRAHNQAASLKVKISTKRMDPNAVHLFHKTTRREEYDRELCRARKDGFMDVFFLNKKEEVTEGAISNIIIQTGEKYFTPPVSCGLLAGTFRAYLLERYPQYIREKTLSLSDLVNADHIYMANSVRGLVKVELEKPA